MIGEFTRKATLDEQDFVQIRELEEICNNHEGIKVKLNWGMKSIRNPIEFSDFFFYQNGKLKGYLTLDGFGNKAEATIIVHPALRRKGIAQCLFADALVEARRRQVREYLLVSYRHSSGGKPFAEAMGTAYAFSEYRMVAEATSIPTLPATELQLERVLAEDAGELSGLLKMAFGADNWNDEEYLRMIIGMPTESYYFASFQGKRIGQIGVSADDNRTYIMAVGIIPEERGKGYGRQMLSALIQKLLDEGHTRFTLDVETQNESALNLYKSCGFQTSTIYDYFKIPL
jgi:ribosomal protein S18 acetylase RimI-like enzyme